MGNGKGALLGGWDKDRKLEQSGKIKIELKPTNESRNCFEAFSFMDNYS